VVERDDVGGRRQVEVQERAHHVVHDHGRPHAAAGLEHLEAGRGIEPDVSVEGEVREVTRVAVVGLQERNHAVDQPTRPKHAQHLLHRAAGVLQVLEGRLGEHAIQAVVADREHVRVADDLDLGAGDDVEVDDPRGVPVRTAPHAHHPAAARGAQEPTAGLQRGWAAMIDFEAAPQASTQIEHGSSTRTAHGSRGSAARPGPPARRGGRRVGGQVSRRGLAWLGVWPRRRPAFERRG
jgi:hypothetical protein